MIQSSIGWSGGKDSALALHRAIKDSTFDVCRLVTTVTSEYDRISVHGVRRELLSAQSSSVKIPLQEVVIPPVCSNEIYEKNMIETLRQLKIEGIDHVIFGDIFLEDVKEYRDRLLETVGVTGFYPIWGEDSLELAEQFIRVGFRAVIVCVDTTQLPAIFAGREFNEEFLSDLPDGVDPCGENGEFHTFVYDGPVFSSPVPITRGRQVLRDNRFLYQDLL